MADNVAITAGTGTTIAADDIGGSVLVQRVKATWGPDGTANDADVATGKPLPIQVRSATGLVPIGEPTDAKSTATDTTSASGISIWKQISASVQALNTAIGSTLWDLGSGTGGTRTQRVYIDTAQLDPVVAHDAADSGSPVKVGGYAKATAPTAVSADADRVNAWFLLNGAQATVLTAAGALIGGDATNGLDVDVTRLSALVAGEAHIGEVGGKTISKAVTLSTDTAAYASGDLIADTQQIDAFFRKADGTGVIQTLTIVDEEAQGVALYVLFHKTSTTMGTENGAPNISDANASAGIQGMVAIATGDWVTISGTKVACIRNIGLPVIAASGTDDLYVSVVNSTGAPDWDADSLVMHIGALLD